MGMNRMNLNVFSIQRRVQRFFYLGLRRMLLSENIQLRNFSHKNSSVVGKIGNRNQTQDQALNQGRKLYLNLANEIFVS
jgi:hypothetical protein